MMRKLLNILFLLCITGQLFSQNLPVHEQYLTDYMLLNPAFVGISETSTIKFSHRGQWLGLDDAPSTSVLSFKTRIKNQNLGIGAYIFNDMNGAYSQFGSQLSLAYHLLLNSKRNDKLILSMGLSFKGFLHTIDESGFNPDIYDPVISYSRYSYPFIDANAGISLFYKQNFVGLAVDNLLPLNKTFTYRGDPVVRKKFNFHIGYCQTISRKQQLISTMVFRTNFLGLNQLDINVKYHFMNSKTIRSKTLKYDNDFWIGLAYRHTLDNINLSPLSIIPYIGFTQSYITISYFYDIGLTPLNRYNYGTHQISLGIKLFHDKFRNWGKHNLSTVLDNY